MTAHGDPSVTTWTRLEPKHSSTTQEGAAARIADPAWLLARQWQLGEFHGSDGGSPASARLRLDAGVLSGYRGLGAGTDGDFWLPYAQHTTPLETLVEREPAADQQVSLRADGGRRFLRLLARQGAGGYRAAYTAAFGLPGADPADTPDAAAHQAVLAGRVPDGAAVYAAFGGDGPLRLPAQPPVAAADQPKVLAAATEFAAWWRSLVDRAGTAPSAQAWDPTRLEHAFGLGAALGPDDLPVTLHAREYHGGDLDWYDLDVSTGGLDIPAPGQPGTEIVRTMLPTPVSYPGMPADRWWEFEDARVHLGGIESGATDLGRMLLSEFAILYSCDWFTMPVELPVGTVARVASLVVTDTFGVRTLVESADHPDWDMFRLRAAGAKDAVFVLPPALSHSLESAPVEEVLLLRDEDANVAWAVERLVEGRDGLPVDRHERYLASLRAAQPLPAGPPVPAAAELDYRLRAGQPPAHWIPLVPQAAADGLRLRRSALPGPDHQPIEPEGDLLAAVEWLAAQEVPSEGARVVRRWQLARWSDGSTHLWLSRRKYTGRGEASSGLRYDVLSRASS